MRLIEVSSGLALEAAAGGTGGWGSRPARRLGTGVVS